MVLKKNKKLLCSAFTQKWSVQFTSTSNCWIYTPLYVQCVTVREASQMLFMSYSTISNMHIPIQFCSCHLNVFQHHRQQLCSRGYPWHSWIIIILIQTRFSRSLNFSRSHLELWGDYWWQWERFSFLSCTYSFPFFVMQSKESFTTGFR